MAVAMLTMKLRRLLKKDMKEDGLNDKRMLALTRQRLMRTTTIGERNFVPTAVVTKPGQVLVNAAKQSSPRAATSISTARSVNTVVPKSKVNDALPKTYSYFKAHSPVNNVTTAGPEVVVSTAEGKRENVVKSSACWIWRPTGKVIDHISKDSGSCMPKRFDYVDPQGRLKSVMAWVPKRN
ncbi:hypothetical protein Tco_1239731 [Tanacetum coccineum]